MVCCTCYIHCRALSKTCRSPSVSSSRGRHWGVTQTGTNCRRAWQGWGWGASTIQASRGAATARGCRGVRDYSPATPTCTPVSSFRSASQQLPNGFLPAPLLSSLPHSPGSLHSVFLSQFHTQGSTIGHREQLRIVLPVIQTLQGFHSLVLRPERKYRDAAVHASSTTLARIS
jgi:hypothetical protein